MPPIDEDTLDAASQESFDDSTDLETADFGDDVGEVSAEASDETPPPAQAAVEESGDTESSDEGEEGLARAADESEGVEAEADGDEAESPPKREPMLPKSRYDSVRRRLREAEAALEAERKAREEAGEGEEAPPVRDFDAEIAAAAKKHAQALLDTDVDAATAANMEMMRLQDEKFQAVLADGQAGTITAAQDSMLTNNLVDELVATNDRLNPDTKAFDQELVTRMNSMRRYFEGSEGLTESQALVKTVETLMPEVFEATPTDAKSAQKLAKKIEAAGKQPPNASKTGEDASAYGQGQTLDITKMSLEDLDKVTEEQWDEMLGNNF